MALSEETKLIIFNKLKKVMLQNATPLVISKQSDSTIELIGNKPVPYGSTKKIVPGMYFASAAFRKDSIVFYFFPCYMNEKEFITIAPETWKTLKGKTCFHYKKETDVNEKELKEMFKKGIAFYKKMKWIN